MIDHLSFISRLDSLQRSDIVLPVFTILGSLSRVVTVDKLFRGTSYSMVMKNRIYHAVPIAVQQRLNGRRGCVEQRRDRGRFVVMDDLRIRSGAESNLMDLGRLNGCGADSLVAEQLIRSCLLIIAPFPVVKDVLVMVSAILIVIKGLGLAGVDLREGRLGLIVLGIAGGMGKGIGSWRGGRFARFRGCRAGRCCGGSCRRGALVIVSWIRLIDVVLVVFVQTTNGF